MAKSRAKTPANDEQTGAVWWVSITASRPKAQDASTKRRTKGPAIDVETVFVGDHGLAAGGRCTVQVFGEAVTVVRGPSGRLPEPPG